MSGHDIDLTPASNANREEIIVLPITLYTISLSESTFDSSTMYQLSYLVILLVMAHPMRCSFHVTPVEIGVKLQ